MLPESRSESRMQNLEKALKFNCVALQRSLRGSHHTRDENQRAMASSSQDPDLAHFLPPNGPADIPVTLQAKIVRCLWKNQTSTPFCPQHYSAYFGYFQTECETWRASGHVEIETYGDLLDLVQHLKDNRAENLTSSKLLSFFPEVKDDQTERKGPVDVSIPVARRHPDCQEESAHNALYLAVRLWLMINVGSPKSELFTGRSNVGWAPDNSIDDVISGTFRKDQPPIALNRLRWPKKLDARRLQRVGGLEITWTSNLADHLYFDEDLEKISLFHHARFLEDVGQSTGVHQILPDDLLKETLLTLALLLPRAKGKCKNWYNKAAKERGHKIKLDAAAADQRLGQKGRDVDQYKYWNDRLTMIMEAFDKSEPKKVSQLVTDRRKKLQWSTFWIAVIILLLTIGFGLIQSVTGILQAYAAYHPYRFSG